jgi:hypothetical protein
VLPTSTPRKTLGNYIPSLKMRTMANLSRKRCFEGMTPGPFSRRDVKEVVRTVLYSDLSKLSENGGMGRLQERPRM